VPATITVDGSLLTLQPVSALDGAAPYTVHLTGVRASDGTALEQELTWSFVTAPPGVGTWTATSQSGAPSRRMNHTAVWTGKEMIVWGGHDGTWTSRLSTGAAYDPATDTWRRVSDVGAPRGRVGHVAAWTGSRMIVWGGYDGDVWLDDGGLYHPETDTWTPLALANAPMPRAKAGAAWTGSELLIWGGYGGYGVDGWYMNSGGRYSVATPGWTAIPSGGPSARMDHGTVWTGTELIMWGGVGNGTMFGDGRRFDPATSTWTAVPATGAPQARQHHTAVWTGAEMIVWGGDDWGGDLATGGRYDPQRGTWTATSLDGAPHARQGHTAIWTGDRMIVWGGYYGTGGIYDPATDAWTPTSVEPATPATEGGGHTAVWTGSEMIVWGGYAGNGVLLDTGARLRP
jgi:N-acetylneuraminic acid mutarotase